MRKYCVKEITPANKERNYVRSFYSSRGEKIYKTPTAEKTLLHQPKELIPLESVLLLVPLVDGFCGMDIFSVVGLNHSKNWLTRNHSMVALIWF